MESLSVEQKVLMMASKMVVKLVNKMDNELVNRKVDMMEVSLAVMMVSL
jgi:hypothetical protein